MADFVICIPSYHRSQSIKHNTLRVLRECGVPDAIIKVFVAEEEVPTYRESLPATIAVIPSVVGCIENRARIREYYQDNQKIIYADDDIKGIYAVCDFTDDHISCCRFNKKNILEPTYVKQIPIPNLMRFLEEGFVTLEKEGAHFGGIYPISNGFFCSHRYTTDLRYICGGFYFEINQRDFKLRGDQYSEDFERTCEFYKRDGKVIRFEYVILKTGYYKGEGDNGKPGGLVESRTIENSRLAQEKLAAMYPEFLKVIPPTQRNKFWNLKIRKQRAALSKDVVTHLE